MFLEVYQFDKSSCDSLIELYKEKEFSVVPGTIAGKDGEGTVDKKIKDCNQISLGVHDIDDELYSPYLTPYFTQLQSSVDEYIKKYIWCNEGDPFTLAEYFNIQHYSKGGGYHTWHCEKSGISKPKYAARHLVFMTYLNDINDDEYNGGTEWLYQNFKVKPKKGLTVIWPAEWMFTHRGIKSDKSEKYIITGWLSYYEKTE